MTDFIITYWKELVVILGFMFSQMLVRTQRFLGMETRTKIVEIIPGVILFSLIYVLLVYLN